MSDIILVRCTLRRSAFSHERVFVIPFEDGSEYRGAVPSHYCLTEKQQPIGDGPGTGESIAGFVIGLVIDGSPDRTVRVELPDGDVYKINEDQWLHRTDPRDAEIVRLRDERNRLFDWVLGRKLHERETRRHAESKTLAIMTYDYRIDETILAVLAEHDRRAEQPHV